MTDAFISYSRRDKEFVRQLHDLLRAQDRDIWIDWDDIPPASDWRAYIKTGIEEADAVIFVISPDSVRSKECRVEVDLALESGKRLIPIMRRTIAEEADKALMHPVINSHNWVYLRDEDNFDEGFAKLISALDTDLEYVRQHTRLLVRAREWENNKRDGSLTLRGSDLAEAEAWLAGSVNKQPIPTPLQTEYIKISRQAETSRSRRLLAGAGVALIVSTVLAVMAIIQWQNAANNLELANVRGTEVRFQAATSESNAVIAQNNAVTATIAQGIAEDQRATAYARGTEVRLQAATADANAIRAENNAATAVVAQSEAERQAQIARGAALAAQAQLEIESGRSELGLLLALEALENYPYTSQAEYALSSAIRKMRNSQHFPGIAGFGATASLSPDGTQLLVANPDNTFSIWNTASGQSVWTITGHRSLVSSAAWSPDGRYFATVSGDASEVGIWDAETGELVSDAAGHVAIWSPDSTRILTLLSDGYVVWDAGTGEQLLSLSSRNVPSQSPPVSWSPDSAYIAVGDQTGVVKVWDAVNGDLIYTLDEHQSPITVASWSPDGTRLLTASGNLDVGSDPGDISVRLWDMRTGERLWVYDELISAAFWASWSPDGTRLFTVQYDLSVRLWDAVSGEPGLSLPGFGASWSPDGSQIVTSSLLEGSAHVWDAFTGVERAVLSGQEGGIPYVEWSRDGKQIMTVSVDGTVRVWNMMTQSAFLSLSGIEPFWWPDGTAIYWWNADGSTSWREIWADEEFSVPVFILAVSPDGTRLLTYDLTALMVAELATGQQLLSLELPDNGIMRADWSPDGKSIAGADAVGNVRVWDAETGQTKHQLKGYNVFWSADSSRLLTLSPSSSGGDNWAIIWNAADGTELRRFEVPENTLLFGGWSPGGDQVALSFQSDRVTQVNVYQADSGNLLYNLPGTALDWSPNGRRIAVVNLDGTVSIRDSATRDLLATLDDAGKSILFANWSPAGNSLMTTTTSGDTAVWPIWQSLDELEYLARDCCVIRQLTAEERMRYGIVDGE